MVKFKLLPCGDTAISCEFERQISPDINRMVVYLNQELISMSLEGVNDTIPAFNSLLINFDPSIILYEKLSSEIKKILQKFDENKSSGNKKKVHMIPVCYESDFAEDISYVSKYCGLPENEIISIHSSVDYLIYMLGFLPGFAYLGGLDPRIEVPRLSSPRTKIPQGSVGIGGNQTGIYPVASPGGWQLIGRTPIKPYDPSKEEPIMYRAGEFIHFIPITLKEFELIKKDVESGVYHCDIVIKEGEA